MMARHNRQHGFSLIEAMIALLIIAVGLLGIASMQAMSISNTATSRIRALAAIEASNMAAYMGANATYWRTVALPFSITVTPPGSTPATNCTSASCTPAEMAAYNLKQWAGPDQLGLLPGGVGTIINNTTQPGVFTVSVGWMQKRMATSAGGQTAAPVMTYYRIVVQP